MPLRPSCVAAITGASSGIGRATGEELARRGASVSLFGRRANRIEALARTIESAGGRALAVPGDVTREADVTALVDRTRAAFGRLDVIVCNAGIGYHGTLDDTPPAVMRQLLDTNVMGTLLAARAAIEVFRGQGSGHVIVVSSIVGRRGIAGAGLYAATKAAQIGLVESLRAEFAGTMLRASIVYPVGTDTEFREAQARDFGRAVTGHGPRQSAASVASAIADCVESPRAEVYPYRRSRALAVLAVLAPATTDRIVRRFGRQAAPPALPGRS